MRRLSTLQLPPGPMLDLTDPEVCHREDITYQQLVGDDRSITQALARRARQNPNVVGMRAPSAALAGAITFVIFHEHLHEVVVTVRSESSTTSPQNFSDLEQSLLNPPTELERWLRAARNP